MGVSKQSDAVFQEKLGHDMNVVYLYLLHMYHYYQDRKNISLLHSVCNVNKDEINTTSLVEKVCFSAEELRTA